MARELGMNPMKLGKLDNHEQELWKMPVKAYIEHLYLKRFGKPSPDNTKKEAQRASKPGDLRPRMGTSVNSVIEPS
jgi:hypothetical protein